MIVSPHHVQTLLFCPLKVYLEAGLGLKPKTEAAEVGRQAHVAYQYLTQPSTRRGQVELPLIGWYTERVGNVKQEIPMKRELKESQRRRW